ncbi:carbohydrate-binding protein [Erwinia mallotivora]|uniref:carbohydrate-binding protein n=1 Tax=Erwinia mallotivora TaxID=69222 RepID=UPI0035E83885
MSPFYFKGINIDGDQPVDPVDPVDPVNPGESTKPTAVITMKALSGSTLLFSAEKSTHSTSYSWSAIGTLNIISPQAQETAVVLPVVTVDTVASVVLSVSDAKGNRDQTVYKLIISSTDAGKPQVPDLPIVPDVPSDYPQWSATAVYVADDKVSHKGVNYIAKFWSNGSEPGLDETTGQFGKPWDYLR